MVRKRWSRKAYKSLKLIFDFYEEESAGYGKRVVGEIIEKIDQLEYAEQYQVDEIVGSPYRRIILRNYRVVYKVVSSKEIEVLQIFDNRQSPERIKRAFKK